MGWPTRIEIREEGPREGFQFEKGPIATDRKVALIQALALTGLKRVQTASFVNPKLVPGWADAEAVAAALAPPPGVEFGALWLNEKGLQRAASFPQLTLDGYLFMSASQVFGKRNQNRTRAEEIEVQRGMARVYARQGIALTRCTIMAAFGCNFQGDIPVEEPMACIEALLHIAAETHPGQPLPCIMLADTMAWATPGSVKRLIGAVRNRWPDLPIGLHLHDTRGLAIANAAAGLDMGVVRFDAAVAGLGGCPFAKHKGAAGNICSEDLVFLCDESGIETGVDLEALSECGRLAEEVVGHPLPGRVKQGGTLAALREGIAAAKTA